MRDRALLPKIARASLAALVGLALAGHPPVAWGAEHTKVPKLAVLDIKTTGTFDAKEVTALSSLVAAEAARFPIKVLAGNDLQTLLSFEKQKQLLGCTDTSCITEIGGAMGVDYLLTSEVGRVGTRWLFTAAVLDVARANALCRVNKTAKDQDELVDVAAAVTAEAVRAIPSVAAAVAAKPPEPPRPAPRADAPKPASPAPPAATEKEAPAGSGRRVAGYALIGCAAALIAGGAVTGTLALLEHNDAKGKPTVDQSTKNDIMLKNGIADGLYAGGVVAAGLGLVLALTAPSAQAAPTPAEAPPGAKVSLATLPGGGAVVVSGRF